jgi:DNA-binding beta-propeller fold protein YncE
MSPIEVALDGYGGVYVADSGNHQIHVFHVDGWFIRTIGGDGHTDGKFRYPTALTIDFGGNLVVSDSDLHRFQVFDPSGQFLSKIGNPNSFPGKSLGEFDHPCDVIIDNDGNYVISDTDNSRIQIFSPKGEFLRCWSAKPPKKVFIDGVPKRSTPIDVAVDFEGQFIVCDSNTHKIQFFDGSTGKFLRSFGVPGDEKGQLRCPNGVSVDRYNPSFLSILARGITPKFLSSNLSLNFSHPSPHPQPTWHPLPR